MFCTCIVIFYFFHFSCMHFLLKYLLVYSAQLLSLFHVLTCKIIFTRKLSDGVNHGFDGYISRNAAFSTPLMWVLMFDLILVRRLKIMAVCLTCVNLVLNFIDCSDVVVPTHVNGTRTKILDFIHMCQTQTV